MAEETPGEKTEKPTQKRLRDAAQKGDVLQSKELATALVVMAGMVWIALAGPAIMEAMARMLIQGLRFDQKDVLNFAPAARSEEHTSEIQSLMRISYAVFCLNKKKSK